MEKIILPIEEKVELRPLQESDAEAVYSTIDANRILFREWFSWVDDTKTIEDSLTFIKGCIVGFSSGKMNLFGIFYKDDFAGVIDLHNIDNINKKAIFGYWLSQKYQGRGIMINAVKAMINYGFTTLDLNRVEIQVATENNKSKAIPKKLGFVKEGTLRQYEWLYDHYVDHDIYSMLKSEFNGRPL